MKTLGCVLSHGYRCGCSAKFRVLMLMKVRSEYSSTRLARLAGSSMSVKAASCRRAAVACILLFAYALTVSCGGTQLSRSQAQELIEQSPEIVSLGAAMTLRGGALAAGSEDGLWKVVRKDVRTVAVTEEAADVVGSVTLDGEASLIPAGGISKLLVEVTGIAASDLGEHFREAQFTWRYSEVPVLLRPYVFTGGTGSADLRLFDDGWRLDRLELTANSSQVLTAEEQSLIQEARKSRLEAQARAIRTRKEERERLVRAATTPSETLATFEDLAWSGCNYTIRKKGEQLVVTDVGFKCTRSGSAPLEVMFIDLKQLTSNDGEIRSTSDSVRRTYEIRAVPTKHQKLYCWRLILSFADATQRDRAFLFLDDARERWERRFRGSLENE